MVKVIGKVGCSACKMTQTVLQNKNVEFEYYHLEDLTQDEQLKYIKLAQENDMISLPLIVVDNKLKTLQEIINN